MHSHSHSPSPPTTGSSAGASASESSGSIRGGLNMQDPNFLYYDDRNEAYFLFLTSNGVPSIEEISITSDDDVRDYQAYLNQAQLRNVNFQGFCLSGLNFYRACFESANLFGAFLIRAQLRGANFKNATLSQARLGQSDLSGAKLHKATLEKADLERAVLNNAVLPKADLTGVAASKAHFKNADLSGTTLIGATLMFANLTGADLRGAKLENTNLEGADLTGADLRGAELKNTILKKADLTESKLEGLSLQGIKLEGAKLNSTDLSTVDLNNARLNSATLNEVVLFKDSDSRFYSHYLKGADLTGASFNGINQFPERRYVHFNETKLSKATVSFSGSILVQIESSDLSGATIDCKNIQLHLKKVTLEGCKFIGHREVTPVVLSHCDLKNIGLDNFIAPCNFEFRSIENCDLREVDLSTFTLTNTKLLGSHFSNIQHLPKEANYYGVKLDFPELTKPLELASEALKSHLISKSYLTKNIYFLIAYRIVEEHCKSCSLNISKPKSHGLIGFTLSKICLDRLSKLTESDCTQENINQILFEWAEGSFAPLINFRSQSTDPGTRAHFYHCVFLNCMNSASTGVPETKGNDC